MIRQFLELPPFVFITLIVQAQLGIAALLASVIALLLLRRTRHERWAEVRRNTYSELIVEEMLNALGDDDAAPVLRRSRRAREREVLKTVLLEHVRSVSGSEKEALRRRYEELGFVDDDLALLRSPLWWRRLSAASDLASLDSGRYALDFHRLSYDGHELVSAFGHYALSGLDHGINQPFPVAYFPVSVRSRRNLMIEILRNWARVHGASSVTDQIAGVRDARLLDALVTAAATTATVDASASFGALLAAPNQFPPAVIEGMLSCLRKVGDPQYVDVVERYARHPNEVVRVRALEYLVAMGDLDVLDRPEIQADRAVGVRRVVEQWRVPVGEAA